MGDTSQSHHRHLEKGLADKLAFLRRADNYPDPPSELIVVETHMAWIFLADHFAYKLKKPIFRPDQDYSTIDARHRDQKVELLLNQKLAKDTYLGLEALRVDHRGHMSLTEDGRACEWLLKMRRLPAERMLDRQLQAGRQTQEQAAAIGKRLGLFYRSGPAVAISFAEYKERFQRGIHLNSAVLTTEAELKPRIEALNKRQVEFIERRGDLLDDSLRRSRVVECHGDLRPEHVCLQGQVIIIDCLQFCREYRLMDYFDDVGFLALECELLGDSDFGERLLQSVADTTGAGLTRELVHFYQSYRASVRARLALLHLLYESSDDRIKWVGKTRVYLDLAETHIRLAG